MFKIVKKLFHKGIVDERGAVSIYLVVVSLFLMLFCGVLIDYARIMVAERQTEDALKAGLRTTMAGMDSATHTYGLFGLDVADDPEEMLKQAIEENLVIKDGEFFRFVDTQLKSSKYSIDETKMLANEYTFENQILEDMKYRAPIEFTLEIIDSFSKVADAMEQASILTDIATVVDKEAEKRENNLDKVKEHLEAAQAEVNAISNEIPGTSAEFPNVSSLEDIVRHFPTYENILEENSEDSEEGSEEESEYDIDDAREFEENAREIVKPLVNNANKAKEELDKALEQLEKAKIRNDLIKEKIENKRTEANDSYDNAQQLHQQHGQGGSDPGLDEARGKIDEASAKLDDYMMDDNFFTEMKQRIEQAKEKVGANGESNTLIESLNHLESITSSSLENSSEQGMRDVINQVKNVTTDAENKVDAALNFFINNRNSYDTEDVQAEEERARQQQEQNNKTMDQYLEEALAYADDTGKYTELADLLNKYQGQASGEPSDIDMEDARDLADSSMNMMDILFENLGEALESQRNKLYINEYILTRFTSHDFTLPNSEAYLLDNNEVEYLIYGLHAPQANFRAAMLELYGLRFAVNFVEAFASGRVGATGPLAFWSALAYAFLNTADDMMMIKKGRKIDFFYRTGIQSDYKDYLRLFMILHTEGSKTQRSMALIDQKEAKDLTEVPTYISGEVEASVDLWFLPVVADMLSKTNILDGNVVDGRYMIEKEASFSY